ncbi:hypothetical protein ACFL45_05940 [Candidatus Neomarinimicrobiota bacterium]
MKNQKLNIRGILFQLLAIVMVSFSMNCQDQKPKIIFETDMCFDVDDVGALAVLHALQNKGETEILAVSFNEVHPSGAAAIDAINTWYGRGDLPIGVYKKPFPDPDSSKYLDHLTKFPHNLDADSAPSALDVYKNVLKEQPDHSVTIVAVGFVNNLNDLLNDSPELVAKKVKELVIMMYVDGDSFNLVRHGQQDASLNILHNWPTPIVLSPPGPEVLTGPALESTPVDNPVREAYYKFFGDKFLGRSSWDQLAVLYGVRGVEDYFTTSTTNTGSFSNGYVWKTDSREFTVLDEKLSNEEFAKIVEDLMTEPPKK